jgi:exodeoxyribonuclease VII large subunit
MKQGSLFAPPSLSVGDITRYLRELMDSDDILRDVWVTGEVSNASVPASGHLYFTLKDPTASLKCVMWKPQVMRLHFALRAGMAVEAHGAVSVYEQGGQYQLYVDAIRPAGEGTLYQEFIRLKAQLEAEGLFDPERKRPLPTAPAKIGIVTSPTGAALQDMLNTLRRRYPLAEVVFVPAAVQGEAAPAELIKALARLNAEPGVDVILLARGGGSIEDLWAFNDEGVVRAVVARRVPVISGVGHETDFTLTDFAADMRAPTPTAAAELATPDQADMRDRLSILMQNLAGAAGFMIEDEKENIRLLRARLDRVSPTWTINNQRQRLDDLTMRSVLAVNHQVRYLKTENRGVLQRLRALNPEAILQRGYAIVRDDKGSLIRKVEQAVPRSKINVKVSNGEFSARVTGSDAGEEK